MPQKTYETIDDCIKRGEFGVAQKHLLALTKSKVARAEAARVAALATRAGLPSLGLKILNPIVRPTRKSAGHASDKEKAQYAICLIRVGAINEALGILKTLDSKEHPEVLLFESVALTSQWNYAETIAPLTEYTSSPKIDDYQRAVGKVNLASALVYERRHEEAGRLLAEVFDELCHDRHVFLKGNTLHLMAVNALLQGQWEEATRWLDEETKSLKSNDSMEEFFLRKWKVILTLLKDGARAQSLKALDGIRDEARRRRHWETIRDCDRFEGFARKDESLLLHLYFGTPFEGFRRQLLRGYGKPVVIPSNYKWTLRTGKAASRPVVDLRDGLVFGKQPRVDAGELRHRFAVILASDFYSPFRLAALHSSLHPDDYFNPTSSPHRIYQAAIRFRAWCRENRVPLDLTEDSGSYRLEPKGAVEILVAREVILDERDSLLKRLAGQWESSVFSAKEASQWLGLPHRSILRALEKGKLDDALEIEGAGPSLRYRFKGHRKAA